MEDKYRTVIHSILILTTWINEMDGQTDRRTDSDTTCFHGEN